MPTLNQTGSPLFYPEILNALFWTVIAYLAGSLMFSTWLVRVFTKRDIRDFGDGNPGATNAFKAGGLKLGIPAALLDYLKGAIPVGLALLQFGVSGYWLVAAALAPILGHAFSVFSRFKGGKAAAVSFGIWTGLTLWEGPTILGGIFGFSVFIMKVDIWTVIFSMIAFLGYVIPKAIITGNYYLLAVWAGNMIIILVKYIPQLGTPVRFRPWLVRLFGGRVD
jgi:glycerol-3-phosphate acyltransferase PlsY